ncbi:hypothetical protein VZT92_003640 [Zoarces viviparus]|uniref:Uncharacterized protein n=1 Tax=Zoarces viviparus TaxID=48416 RepID=A0AAW1FU51_ZOAVI
MHFGTNVEDACSLQLLRPNATKWNSLFLAVERLLSVMKDKGEGTIRVLCTDLKVPMFNPAELAFLTEYAAVMSPVNQHLASRGKCPHGVATSNNQPADRQTRATNSESSCH